MSHPRGSILDMEDILKLNYFTADDVRSRENPFLCVCRIPNNLINIFKWLFTQFFNTTLFL